LHASQGSHPEVGSGESPSEHSVEPTAERLAQRFENYELAKDDDGKPVELGRGAMGVTYKAFDVDLRCSVTLKVISERYIGDQSARLRFLREARAAASVRHPNVASVLGAMPAYFATRCMTFIFRVFSGVTPPLRLISSEPEEHCYRS
jgi:hypothetical protein